MVKNIFILGRQPNLGTAELERLIGPEHISVFSELALITNEAIDMPIIRRLGGTQKIGEVIGETPLMSWPEIEDYIRSDIVPKIQEIDEGKIRFGISCYGLRVKPSQINGSSLSLKKIIKSGSRSIRVVPNNSSELSTAQVLHNRLTGTNGFELLIVSGSKSLVFARTLAIQDINGYAGRDQNRPMRDARVGMLPPKLAQIMINLARPQPDYWVVDPFCGTGVILQEALLMNFKAFGTDINKRMIEYTATNLQWLEQRYKDLPEWRVEVGDATSHHWEISPSTVVCETDLGRPLTSLPPMDQLRKHANELSLVIERFLANLAGQLQKNTEICIGIPAWVTASGFVRLPLLDHLEKIGYNRLSFKNVDTNELIYFRPNQLVARQLLVLIRK